MLIKKTKTSISVILLTLCMASGVSASSDNLWNKLAAIAAGSWSSTTSLTADEVNQLKLLANSGDANAQYALGVIHQAKHEHSKAEYWLKLAADQGHIPARYSYIENAAGHAMAKLVW